MKKIEFFKVQDNKINRVNRHCPKCGPGVFLGEHKNRFSCGKCGYTEFKVGDMKQSQHLKTQEKPVEQPIKEQAKLKVIHKSSEEKLGEGTAEVLPPKTPIEDSSKSKYEIEEKSSEKSEGAHTERKKPSKD